MKVLQFQQIARTDPADPSWGYWSRSYEYPLVLNLIHALGRGGRIHNTACGSWPVHQRFARQLDETFGNVTHSDVIDAPGAIRYDLTQPPLDDLRQAFEFVLCVSTLEHIQIDHTEVLRYLLRMVQPHGFLVVTFDLPGLQLPSVERFLGRRFTCARHPISGLQSVVVQRRHARLTCGLLVIAT